MTIKRLPFYFFVISMAIFGSTLYTANDSFLQKISIEELLSLIVKQREDLHDQAYSLLKRLDQEEGPVHEQNKKAMENKIVLYQELIQEANARLAKDLNNNPQILRKLSPKARDGITKAISMIPKSPLNKKVGMGAGMLGGAGVGAAYGLQAASHFGELAALVALFAVPTGAIGGLIAGALYGYEAVAKLTESRPYVDLTQGKGATAIAFLDEIGQKLDQIEEVMQEQGALRSLQNSLAQADR